MSGTRYLQKFLLPLLGVLALFAAWEAAALLAGTSSFLLATPYSAMVRATEMVRSGELNEDFAATLSRWFSGFALAVVIGAPVGLAIGVSGILREASSFVLEFFRSLPVTALFPVFLVFFGIGDVAMSDRKSVV